MKHMTLNSETFEENVENQEKKGENRSFLTPVKPYLKW